MTLQWAQLAAGLSWVAALWPILAIFAAAALALLEHWVLHDSPPGHELTRLGRYLVELLSATRSVLMIAAGLGLALMWGAR